MKTCKGCGEDFKVFLKKDGKNLNLSRRSYCLECSPFGELSKNKKEVVNGKRECIRCLTFKDLSEFELRGKTKYYRSCCSKCENERTTEYQQNLKIKSIQYLGGGCSICGYSACNRSLHFHHLDPKEKSFTIGKKTSLKWETIKAELDKCILVCANCHGEIHDGIIEL